MKLDKHKQDLLKFPNVVGCAVATKRIKGIDTGKPCYTVFVSEKVSEAELAREQVIPKTIEAVETDVVEVMGE